MTLNVKTFTFTLDRVLAITWLPQTRSTKTWKKVHIRAGNVITWPRLVDHCCFRYVTTLKTRSKEALNIWYHVCLSPVQFDGTFCTMSDIKTEASGIFFSISAVVLVLLLLFRVQEKPDLFFILKSVVFSLVLDVKYYTCSFFPLGLPVTIVLLFLNVNNNILMCISDIIY